VRLGEEESPGVADKPAWRSVM